MRIRDVAGYVLHGEGLRLQATDRSCKSVEQTHDFISAYETHFALSGLRTGCPVAITVPSNLCNYVNSLQVNGGQQGPPSAVLFCRQAADFAGVIEEEPGCGANFSATPFMQ